MNQNVRFYALIGVVVLVIGGMFYFIRGRGGSETPPSPPAAKQNTETPRGTIEPPGFAPSSRNDRLTPLASRPPAPREMTTSTKVGNYAISGQVLLQDDESPVEGADVSVYWTDEDAAIQTYDEENVWKARTNVKGFYRIDKLPASQYVVIARKGELAGVSGASINPREPEDNIVTVVLRASGTISGTVMNDKREPIADALVALGRGKHGQRDLYAGELQTKSGADGSFALEFVEDGTWTVFAKADGYAVGSANDVASSAQNVAIVLKPGGSVSGSVVSVDSSKPVPNVALRLSSSGRFDPLNSQKGTTDGDGKFAFKDLADGAYEIRLDKSPYVVSGPISPVTIENANAVDNVRINVVMGGSISGRATDAVTGAPIKGMSFSARGSQDDRTDAETDDDGVYKIEGLQSGQYVVRRMWMAGYRHGEDREDKSAAVKLGEDVTGIDFAVPPGLCIRGRVVDKSGEPLGMVDVTSSGASNGEGESMVTDEKGRWVHRGFSPGTVVTIYATKSGYSAPPMENVTIPDHDLDGIEIVMDTGASIEGVVVDKQGNPVEDVYVAAMATDPASPNQGQQTGWSRNGGKFKVQGLAQGTYKLSARPPRSWGQPASTGNDVQVGKGEKVTGIKVIVDFDSGSKIAGRVVDSSGKPIRNVNVQVYMPTGGGGGGDATTDNDGKYEIAGLQAGAHWVNAYHPNYTQLQQQQVEAPNPNFTITLRGNGTISGRVLDARSGGPIRTFSITVLQGLVQNVDPGDLWGTNGRAFVDDQGRFEIQVADGGAMLYVTAQGFAPKTVPFPNTKEAETKSGVEIRLDAGGAVEGTVTTKTGGPVAGARIYVGRAPMGDWKRSGRPAVATTDANGAFHIDSLPAQTVRLFALAEGYAPAAAATATTSGGPAATVHIVMGTGGTVKGTVRVAGKPAAGFGVSISAQDHSFENSVSVDAHGEFEFTGVPQGDMQVGAYRNSSGNVQNVSKQVDVLADRTITVDFDFVDGKAALEGVVMRDGLPVSGAWVIVMVQTEPEGYSHAGVQTDASGAFRVDGLPPGEASVSVRVRESVPASQQTQTFHITLEDGATARLDANLSGGTRVNGTVSGLPDGWMASAVLVAGSVEISPESDLQEMYQGFQERIVGSAQTTADGSFQIKGAKPGEYTVIVVAFDPQSGSQTFKQASVTVTEDGEASVNVTLP